MADMTAMHDGIYRSVSNYLLKTPFHDTLWETMSPLYWLEQNSLNISSALQKGWRSKVMIQDGLASF